MSSRKKNLKQRFLPLPVSVYLVVFFMIAAILFSMTGWWMLNRMEIIRDVAQSSVQQAARKEVNGALDVVRNTARNHARAIASWDESYQQLNDSTFYGYWRNNRVLSPGLLAGYVTDAELYDTEGEPLAAQEKDSRMPARLPERPFLLSQERDGPVLYIFHPVIDKGDNHTLLGHAGLRIDFLAALQQLNRFNRVKHMTITTLLPQGDSIDASDLASVMSFEPVELEETNTLEQVMRETLRNFAVLATIMLVIAYILAARLLHAPLRRLTRHINILREGKLALYYSDLNRPLHVEELETLRVSLNEYQSQLNEMHTNLDQKNQELWSLAHNDPLTGIANRRAYEQEWKQLQQVVHGQRISISVLLIDCDHFKAINDTYGHDTGDKVIQAIAHCLSSALRKNDRLYRIGGDEFAIHLLNTSMEDAELLANRCQTNLTSFDFRRFGIKEPVRFSIGVAYANGENSSELSHLHKFADIAMYKAKGPGFNKIVRYDPSMDDSDEARVSNRYVSAVYQALENGIGIEMHFQPIVAINQHTFGFYEVLTRLRDQEGLITPNHIFPMVAAEGLSAEFDFALLRHLVGLFEKGAIPKSTGISINLDGTTLMHPELMKHIEELGPHLKNSHIVLEVTETALISDLGEAHEKLQQLRAFGFAIALDDFGSGYSSLRYLSNMPVDIIKFDINMTRDLMGERGQRIIAEDIANMILKAGYQLIAEGIESEVLLGKVVGMGFTHAQGFLLSKPLKYIEAGTTLQLAHYPHSSAAV
jgi:diguanylate cyclase (GGDEF)-like protein